MLETERLTLRPLTTDDAAFILELVNDPDWLRNIGDRNVHTLADAERYITDSPMAKYSARICGNHLVRLRTDDTPIGTCCLLHRDGMDDVEIGYAFLPAGRGQGYAAEAVAALLKYGQQTLGLRRIIAIVTPTNTASLRLLEKLGFVFERNMTLPGETQTLNLLALNNQPYTLQVLNQN